MMNNQSDKNECYCGKKRSGLNLTNWTRHLKSCKKRKLPNDQHVNIVKFFKSTGNVTIEKNLL